MPVALSMRKTFSVISSEAYHLDPRELRGLGLEVRERSAENAFDDHSACVGFTREQRRMRWEALVGSIREKGYDEEEPILIMINRKDGRKDRIFQGHHRLAACIEAGLDRVPVRFVW